MEVRERATTFIEAYVSESNASGVVVNLSGGLDSTVTATLTVEALGPESVYGLVLPSSKIDGATAQDAEEIAELLGIQYDTVHLQPLLTVMSELAPEEIDLHGDPIVRGNLTARLRMAFAYLAANAMERLVVGTTNRSELLLGYFTKYGDGATDFLPLGEYYKTEVRALAEELDVPEFIHEKPPTAAFWPGQSDINEIGSSYELIDATLFLRVEKDLDSEAITSELEVETNVVERILEHYHTTSHKREFPPAP
ncbi:NAD+ synthase [Natronomonas salina]|uniref:NAD+ synthase n=1 Tax=Natronomonas salina TaxID=1710540 RepID=UPI001FE55648|nr:NAD+ synthase [Natronomonas salina]